ncbi:DUF4365 domain-containing protein [Streptomyces sp. NBC_00287]|uniref:DUF4365 domain-containing protein n=1 Tax=Streptomyces sp. NBC_00287 TaxID=2975702 RepID=UPI002E27CA61|nr:DUF4365 domain-containing protein [Streptomyces sp. NBC_00287]
MMELLQRGYVTSVAATAGCTTEVIQNDSWGIDVQFVRPPVSATQCESMLWAQLKSTTQHTPDPQKEFFSYQFTKRQYFDHMVKYRTTGPKAVLIVMTVPQNQLEWTEVGHSGLFTKRACYWVHLEGETSEADRPTVRIPTKNIFDASALTEILDKLDRGESLRE